MQRLQRGPMNPHEVSKPGPINFYGRVLAPCVLRGHGGYRALLQEERGREAQLPGLHRSQAIWQQSGRSGDEGSNWVQHGFPSGRGLRD